MSTWHQNQARVPLYHATKWTLVIDPPGGQMSVQRCESRHEAEMFQRLLNSCGNKHTYILEPQGDTNGLGISDQGQSDNDSSN